MGAAPKGGCYRCEGVDHYGRSTKGRVLHMWMCGSPWHQHTKGRVLHMWRCGSLWAKHNRDSATDVEVWITMATAHQRKSATDLEVWITGCSTKGTVLQMWRCGSLWPQHHGNKEGLLTGWATGAAPSVIYTSTSVALPPWCCGPSDPHLLICSTFPLVLRQ